MDNVKKIDDLKNQLESLFLEMPQTFFQLEQRNKSAFLISREIEKLENPESYKNNIQHWENYSMNF